MIRPRAEPVKASLETSGMLILALDVGTSSVKAAVLDVATGQPVGPICRVAYPLDQPTPDTAVIPSERLWDAICQMAWEAARDQRVEGLGISCLSPALILLDKDHQPLTPIITHLDRRARKVARQIWASVGAEFLASTGNRPLPGGISGVTANHLLTASPNLRRTVRHYLHVNGWLGLRFTGQPAFDRGNASFTGLYDTMNTRAWSQRWCEYLEVDPAWLPPVLSGDATLGQLLPDAAAQLGAPAGIPVKLGTADTSCAMLAAGMGPDDLLHVVGTTQVLAVFTDHPVPAANRLTRQLGVGEAYIHVTHNPVGGVALDWIHHLCFREQSAQQFYAESIPAALELTEEVVLDPPFLGGDRLEIEPRRAGFRELGLSTDRLDLLASVLQAMRRHHQTALEALGTSRGYRRVFLTGGGAEVVQQLIPEYRQWEVVRLEEGSLRGVAALFRAETSAAASADLESNRITKTR
jgi:sugar (pentulose or hexulose) kinase